MYRCNISIDLAQTTIILQLVCVKNLKYYVFVAKNKFY